MALLLPAVGQTQSPSQTLPAAGTVLPAGTSVDVAVDRPLDSQTVRRGDIVPIRLRSPVMVGDRVAVPAGAPGVGEVIHAVPAGAGEPGEITIAARYLTVEGRRVPLQGFRISERGLQSHDAKAKFSVLGIEHTFVGYPAQFVGGENAPAELAEPFALAADLGPAPTPQVPARWVDPLPAGLPHPPAGLGQVVIFRLMEPYGSKWRTTVYLGDTRVKSAEYAYMVNGSYLAFHVKPGVMVFSVFGEGPDLVHLEIEPGETYYVGISTFGGRGGRVVEDIYPATQAEFMAIGPKTFKPYKK